MKNTCLVLFLIIGILLTGCKDDDEKELQPENLPLTAQEFLQEYFPDQAIVSITLKVTPDTYAAGGENNWISPDVRHYYVLLTDDMDVGFDMEGSWLYVTAENGIPSSAAKILDNYVYQTLTEKEPQAKIRKLSALLDHNILITLDNGHRYAQSQQLAFNGTTLAEVDFTTADEKFQQKFEAFLKRNLNGMTDPAGRVFKITEPEGVAYRLFLADQLVISFDENGDWIHAGNDDFAAQASEVEPILTQIIENEMPPSVADALRNYPGDLAGIRIISSYGDGHYGFRFKNKDLLVNERTGIVPPPLGAAGKLVTDYYGLPYKVVYPAGITLVGAYEYASTFLFEGENNDVVVETDRNGAWTKIYAFYAEEGKEVRIGLPQKLVEGELPAKAVGYLNEKHEGWEAYGLTHKNKTYGVYINKQHIVNFYEDGSHKSTSQILL